MYSRLFALRHEEGIAFYYYDNRNKRRHLFTASSQDLWEAADQCLEWLGKADKKEAFERAFYQSAHRASNNNTAYICCVSYYDGTLFLRNGEPLFFKDNPDFFEATRELVDSLRRLGKSKEALELMRGVFVGTHRFNQKRQ